jgi:serine O-acetyltransferase
MLLVCCFQGYQSLQSYRIANVLWNQGRKVLALALQSRISEVNPDS